jgi:MFS family permease
MLLYAYYGTVYATIQDIIEPPLRGMAMAIYFCAMYFLGGVFGPSVTGWLSDFLARSSAEAAGSVDADGSIVVTAWHKALGLHDAMYAIPLLNAVLVLVLIAAARTVRKDYAEASHRSPAQGENA